MLNLMARKVLCAAFLISVSGCLGCGSGGNSGGGGGGGNGGGGTTATSAHPPFRTRYLRTDLQYDPNELQFFPPHFTAYDGTHKRFFVSNTTQNRIDVFDGASESQIGTVVVPLPFGLDVAPDGSKLYVGTAFGDVYLIDPGAMQVLQRFPSATLGPQGFTATQTLILGDGRLALMGALGGEYFDGSPNFAIWDPIANTLQEVPAGEFLGFGAIELSGDRTKVLVGGANIQELLLYDPIANSSITSPFIGGAISNIIGTPDGKRFFVFGNVADEVFDANTMAELGSFQSTCSAAAISLDGSTIFCPDSLESVLAYDTNSLAQTGWIPSFNVLDLQAHLVPSAVDETGLIAGPIGHGVAFLDSKQMESGTGGTDISISFLTPSTGSPSGGAAIQANYGVPEGVTVTKGTVYVGNGVPSNLAISPVSITGDAPPASFSGVADFTVVLPDGSMDMMPEDFSYGPTIVEVSTNAASAEGGAQGAIFGYGLGQQPSDVQVSIGGQPATVVQVSPSAAPTFPYPFPMGAVIFTIPPGTAGATSSVTVTTAAGTASASNSFNYVPALQSYALPGSSLMQGVYDTTRGVLYFTDQAQIDVFSPASHNWLAPIPISFTNPRSRLVGVALSPDGNTLAVSDAGNNDIYVLNPSSPNSVKAFFVNTGVDVQPYGLAVTNSAAVYYATQDQNVDPSGGFNKLDTNTGVITNFELVKNGDAFVRVLLTPDGNWVFVNDGSGDAGVWVVNTSDDSITEGIQATLAGDGNEDAALSGDGTVLLASDLLMDDSLAVFGDITYVDRDTWLPVAVYGQKVSEDGSLVFQPLTDGIDVHDGASGLLLHRVQFPVQLANVYDALALDNTDNLIFAITSTGIVQIDLHSLPVAAQRKNESRSVGGLRRTQPVVSQAREKGRNGNALGRPHLRHLAPSLGSSPRGISRDVLHGPKEN